MKYCIFIFALLLISCERITEGTIVDKKFIPEHRDLYFTHQQIGKVSMATPHWRTVPDNWMITFRGKLEGETEYRTVDVTADEYYRYNIGQHFRIKE